MKQNSFGFEWICAVVGLDWVNVHYRIKGGKEGTFKLQNTLQVRDSICTRLGIDSTFGRYIEWVPEPKAA